MNRHVQVVGGCGGAGSSMVAIALSILAERLGTSVVLIDLDTHRGDLAGGLGSPGARTIADLPAVQSSLTAQHLRAASVTHPAGFALIPGAPANASLDRVSLARAMMGVDDAPPMIIDAGSGLSPVASALRDDCRTVLVSPTDSAGCRISRRTAAALGLTSDGARLVINRGARPEALRPGLIARAHGLEIAALLPHAPSEACGIVDGIPRNGRRARILRTLDGLARDIFGSVDG
ncbi:MAG: hypothetical protein R2878_13995 [Thermoleophilia bacterium]